MGYQAIELQISDKIAHLRFNRPEALNAMNKDMWLTVESRHDYRNFRRRKTSHQLHQPFTYAFSIDIKILNPSATGSNRDFP